MYVQHLCFKFSDMNIYLVKVYAIRIVNNNLSIFRYCELCKLFNVAPSNASKIQIFNLF